jgi:hypothetical protein
MFNGRCSYHRRTALRPVAGRRGYNPPVRSGYSSLLLAQEAAVLAGSQLPLLLGRAAGAAVRVG